MGMNKSLIDYRSPNLIRCFKVKGSKAHIAIFYLKTGCPWLSEIALKVPVVSPSSSVHWPVIVTLLSLPSEHPSDRRRRAHIKRNAPAFLWHSYKNALLFFDIAILLQVIIYRFFDKLAVKCTVIDLSKAQFAVLCAHRIMSPVVPVVSKNTYIAVVLILR